MPQGDAPIDLKELIRLVERRCRGPELERLAVAFKYGELLKGTGDDLVDHFVEEARAAGCSWSQIGEQLGVTKQAAQQRHVVRRRLFGRRGQASSGRRGALFARFTQPARDAVALAQEEAERLDHNYIGAEHLLMGLLRQPEGVAAMALRKLDVTLPDVRRDIEEMIGRGPERVSPGRKPFTPRAKKVLQLALREARSLGHDDLGTEHLVLALLDEGEGVAAQVLHKHGVKRAVLRRAVTDTLNG